MAANSTRMKLGFLGLRASTKPNISDIGHNLTASMTGVVRSGAWSLVVLLSRVAVVRAQCRMMEGEVNPRKWRGNWRVGVALARWVDRVDQDVPGLWQCRANRTGAIGG